MPQLLSQMLSSPAGSSQMMTDWPAPIAVKVPKFALPAVAELSSHDHPVTSTAVDPVLVSSNQSPLLVPPAGCAEKLMTSVMTRAAWHGKEASTMAKVVRRGFMGL